MNAMFWIKLIMLVLGIALLIVAVVLSFKLNPAVGICGTIGAVCLGSWVLLSKRNLSSKLSQLKGGDDGEYS